MSAKELKNFKSQLAMLSFTEQLSLMEYLLKLMKKRQEKASNNTFDSDSVARNGLDEAIAEEERGEVEVFDSFDEFKAAMAR